MNGKATSENWAGKSTNEIAARRKQLRKGIGLFSICLVISAGFAFLSYLIFGHPGFILGIAGLILFLLLIFKIDQIIIPVMGELKSCERNAIKGARAEIKTGALLDQLSEDHIVWHDLKTNCGNIDHLVFRNDGAVFLIETKSHSGNIAQQNGELRRDGRPLEKNFIAQMHQNVFWLKEYLKEGLGFEPQWIYAAIAFSDGYVEKHLEIKGVAVFNVSFLVEWMRRQPGNPNVASLWPKIENLKSEHSSSAPNRLAPQAALG